MKVDFVLFVMCIICIHTRTHTTITHTNTDIDIYIFLYIETLKINSSSSSFFGPQSSKGVTGGDGGLTIGLQFVFFFSSLSFFFFEIVVRKNK